MFADIWCPFAHVGLRRVVERRQRGTVADFLVLVRAWPLELVNGEPLDPETTARHVRELRDQVAPDLFGRFDPAHFPATTLPALALAHAAYQHDPSTGEAVSLALRHALFEEGLDISRPEILEDVARRSGVPAGHDVGIQDVLDEWHEGVERGVKGSPHFFCREADAFCPSLDIVKDRLGHLAIHPDLGALDGLLDNCFGR